MANKWFPSHMGRAKVTILENIDKVDAVIELVDARAPLSSRSEQIRRVCKGKSRIIVINKSDLIEEKDAERIEDLFKQENRYSLHASLTDYTNVKRIFYMLDRLYESKQRNYRSKGVKGLSLKVMIIGIPNVGKSRLINTLSGRHVASVANKPGHTKGPQWIRILKNVDLLDTPGVLWSTDNEEKLFKLSLIGSMKDDDPEGLANYILGIVDSSIILERYKTSERDLESLSKALNEKDITRIARRVVDEFREGKLGKFVLDKI